MHIVVDYAGISCIVGVKLIFSLLFTAAVKADDVLCRHRVDWPHCLVCLPSMAWFTHKHTQIDTYIYIYVYVVELPSAISQNVGIWCIHANLISRNWFLCKWRQCCNDMPYCGFVIFWEIWVCPHSSFSPGLDTFHVTGPSWAECGDRIFITFAKCRQNETLMISSLFSGMT